QSTFTDATLACEGKFYPVHKFVLSTCSEYFSAIFEWTPCVNPVVVINNISSHNLEPLLDFMYRGETNVQECFIQDVMKAAECLDIKGLSLRQEESNYARNRPKSPVNSDEPKKKRRKSESKKKMSFLKPQLQSEGLYGQQVSSPLQASTASVRPTTPLHQTSPHHTPPMHSPSLHSASPHPSPHPLSSAASSPSSQPSLQPVSLQIPSPKPHLSPMPHLNTQNQFLKTISPFREASTSNSLQLQASTSNSLQLQASASNSLQMQASTNSSLQMQASQQPIEVFSSHHRDHFSCLKDDQSNFPVSTIPGVVSSREPTILPVSQEVSHSQFRKFTPSVLPERIMHEAGIPHEVVQSGSSNLTHMDQKMIGIGEELHLEGPVKELEIATEDGTVSIPEILEGLVDMRHLYDSKVIHHEGMQVSIY
ncbi:UNVERIFIED_CONTAM: hypothetical protein GTU68_063108, partial [Idotea baltica]|nr:hypothetical protein [Idotea baltica]